MKIIKTSIFLLSVIFIFHTSYSQEIIELSYDMKEGKLTPKTNNIKFKTNSTYQFKISGINTSYIKCDFNAEFYYLSSSTPKILEPIFPGIKSNRDLNKKADFIDFKNIISTDSSNQDSFRFYKNIFDEKFDDLYFLKASADTLYKWNLDGIDTLRANAIKKDIFQEFEISSIDQLKTKVLQDVQLLEVIYNLYKNSVEKLNLNDTSKSYLIEDYIEIKYAMDRLKEDDILKYVDIINEASAAKDFVFSKKITAKKDLLNLNIVLVDTYKSDTIYNEVSPFYPMRNFSFDFSSGFFYNNLSENSYSLEARDTLLNNVLQNETTNFDISFGALGHISYKFTNYFKCGFSMGAALSPLDGKTRYMLGGSVLLFRERQLGLNAGVIFAKMKELAVSVKSDEMGNYVPINITEVPTYNKNKSGFYFGITYNLTSRNK